MSSSVELSIELHPLVWCSSLSLVSGLIGALEGGSPMSHDDFNKYVCCPVDFKKLPCLMSLSFQISCHMPLRPKIPHVTLSILGVYGHYIIILSEF